MSGRIRVLVVDDHAVVRRSARTVLDNAQGIVVFGDCADGDQAVAASAVLNPDVVVTDVSMPVLSGVDATRLLLSRDQAVRVRVQPI